jgi:hypothetical protein
VAFLVEDVCRGARRAVRVGHAGHLMATILS